NDTLYNSNSLIRIMDVYPFEEFGPGQVELRNNLLFGADLTDIALFHASTSDIEPADVKHLGTVWDFECNWRDLAGASSGNAAPLAARDRNVANVILLSRDSTNRNFLRPPSGSALASSGAGKDDPSLPEYVGAVPPIGVEPWDWERPGI